MPAKKNAPAIPETVHVATGTKAPATEKRKAVIGFAEKHGFNVDSFCHETGLDDRYAIPVAEAAADHLTGLGFTVDSGRGFVSGGPAPAQPAAAPAATARIAVVREPGITTVVVTPPDVAKPAAEEVAMFPEGTAPEQKAAMLGMAIEPVTMSVEDRVLAALFDGGPADIDAIQAKVGAGPFSHPTKKQIAQARTGLIVSGKVRATDDGAYELSGPEAMALGKAMHDRQALAVAQGRPSTTPPAAPRAKRAPKVIPAAVDGVLTLEKEVGNSVNGAYITIKVGDAFKPGQKVRVAISLAG